MCISQREKSLAWTNEFGAHALRFKTRKLAKVLSQNLAYIKHILQFIAPFVSNSFNDRVSEQWTSQIERSASMQSEWIDTDSRWSSYLPHLIRTHCESTVQRGWTKRMPNFVAMRYVVIRYVVVVVVSPCLPLRPRFIAVVFAPICLFIIDCELWNMNASR